MRKINCYKTVENNASAEHEIKRSRFIGYVRPVTTNEQAVAFIDEIRKKHRDARHNVYAYSLRDGNMRRYSDDGEPQGTAGVPVLEVLTKSGVTDCAVVVTRYFGGILLGTGGLVHAYSLAAKSALEAGRIVLMSESIIYSVECDYTFYGKLTSIIQDFNALLQQTDFSDNVNLTIAVDEELSSGFETAFMDACCGRFELRRTGIHYVSKKIEEK